MPAPVGPIASSFCVQPAALVRAAACADGTAALLAAVARQVGAIEVPTQEARSAQAADAAMLELQRGLRAVEQELVAGAAAARAAARRYRQVDGSVVAGR